MARLPILIVVSFLMLCQTLHAEANHTLDHLLKQNEAPEGVVFEIITADDNGLEWAMPRTRQYIKQLHEKFPQLAIAVVTHGREMFALQNRDIVANQHVHNQVQSLLQDENVSLHACGTYAGWRGLTREDFPAYVDVTASGPATINDYVALGYVKVIIQAPD